MGVIWIYTQVLQPVGSINGEKIYKYQVNEILADKKANIVKDIAQDRVFYKAISELGIHTDDKEVDAELADIYKRYGGQKQTTSIMLDTSGGINSLKNSIKIGILRNKAIELFKQDIEVSEEEVIYYYYQNSEKYTGEYDDIKDKVRDDLLSERGGEKLEEYLEKFKSKSKLVIF